MTKIYALILVVLVAPILSCSQSIEQEFQEQLDSIYQQNKDAVGAIIHLEIPDKNISWTSAVGFSDKEKKTLLNKDQPLLIASNTKTYVAASILRLVEMGHFKIDRSLRASLSEKNNQLLKKAGYDIDKKALLLLR